MPDEYVVRDNPEELRYEIFRDGEVVGGIWYRTAPGVIVLVHTEVAPTEEGQGVGSRLVSGALDDIRARGLRVAPVCPFVAAYLRRHPEQRDLVVRDPATPE
jgi:predicted GNAT family acetyltransferase